MVIYVRVKCKIMDKLFIVIPAYNEAENIKNVIDDWYPVLEKHNGNGESRLLIINDGSKDNTYEIVKECANTRPLLVPLSKENGGHGSAVLYGYMYSIDNGADYIFQTDSDGQTLPSEFEAFWNIRNDYVAVFGNRSNRQDGIFRVFTENILRLILRMIFKVRIPDSNAPFRLMKCEILEKYVNMLPSEYNLPNVMLTTFYMYYHEKVEFLEITFKPRQGGTNSIKIKSIIKIGWRAIVDFWDFRRNIG